MTPQSPRALRLATIFALAAALAWPVPATAAATTATTAPAAATGDAAAIMPPTAPVPPTPERRPKPQRRHDDPPPETWRVGGTGYFALGLGWPGFADNLNAELRGAGLGELNATLVGLGGGGHFWAGDLLIGGFGLSVGIDGDTGGGFESTLGGGFGMFQTGLNVLKHRRLSLYPLVGLGGGGYALDLISTAERDFDAVLASPPTDAHPSAGGWLVLFGLGAEWMLAPGQDGHAPEAGGWIVGLRAGYMLAPHWGGGWALEGNGPDVPFNGPFVMLTIGGGGMAFAPYDFDRDRDKRRDDGDVRLDL